MEYLQVVLQKCLKDKLGPSGHPRHDVTDLAKNIGAHFRLHLQSEFTKIKFLGDPELIGTAAEGLQVSSETTCDFLFNIQLPEEIELSTNEPRGDYLGFWLVKKVSNEESPIDKFLKEHDGSSYISPLEMSKVFREKLCHVAKCKNFRQLFPRVEEITCTCDEDDPTISFDVTFTSIGFHQENAAPPSPGNGPVFSSMKFRLQFTPSLRIGHRRLMGKKPPSCVDLGDQALISWQQTFATEERDRMIQVERGCSSQCVRLLEHLAVRRPEQFGQIDPYVYKTILLYVLDAHHYPENWRDEHLSARFVDMFKKLEDVLRDRKLDQYYMRKKDKKSVNILVPMFSDETLESLHQYVSGINKVGEQAYMELYQA